MDVHIECELPGVRKLGSRIWYDHLGEGEAIENGPNFSVIIIGDG
jgi:hypothetical protein